MGGLTIVKPEYTQKMKANGEVEWIFEPKMAKEIDYEVRRIINPAIDPLKAYKRSDPNLSKCGNISLSKNGPRNRHRLGKSVKELPLFMQSDGQRHHLHCNSDLSLKHNLHLTHLHFQSTHSQFGTFKTQSELSKQRYN